MRCPLAAILERHRAGRANCRRQGVAGCRTGENKILAVRCRSCMEVAIFQANIELRADRIIDLGKPLPCELAAAVAELMHAGIARTDADAAADTGLATEIEPAIDHRVPHVRSLVDPEVCVGREIGAGPGIQQSDERRVDGLMFDLAVHVANLALKPEHAKVIAADQVGIDSGLIFQAPEVGVGNGRWSGASRWRKRVAENRPSEIGENVNVLAFRPDSAQVTANVPAVVSRNSLR